jgi:hypothetical protein
VLVLLADINRVGFIGGYQSRWFYWRISIALVLLADINRVGLFGEYQPCWLRRRGGEN